MNLYFDGSTTSNSSGYGWVAMRKGRMVVAEGHSPIKRVTNNVAEYVGLISGLWGIRNALLPGEPIEIRGDSMLVIKQVEGKFRVKSPHLVPFRDLAQKRVAEFRKNNHPIILKWVKRETNKYADRLAGMR